MRRRKPPPAWYEDILTRLRFERGAARLSAGLDGVQRGRGRNGTVTYRVTIEVPEYESRVAEIKLLNTSEPIFVSVHVDGPVESPHRYADGALCMWYPRDPE